MAKQATVYLRKSQYLIHAMSQTTAGVWILSEPCTALASTQSDRELGTAVGAALDASRTGVPHPTEWKGVFDPMLRLAGVKTWNAFATGAASADVEHDGVRIAVVPATIERPRDGFRPDRGRTIVLQGTSAEELGAAVRAALG